MNTEAPQPVITLRCEAVGKRYRGVNALVNITLNFPAEGVIAIVGPNGAGKTTLLNVISGFVCPDSGRCFLGNKEITRLAPNQIVRLGLSRTFQDLRLISRLSALENVMLALPSQRGERLIYALSRFGLAHEERENRAQAMRLLQLAHLEPEALTLTRYLSYGKQKLLTLVCCLATQAKILLLDEPLAGIDPKGVDRTLELMKHLRNEGLIIIFIEHNLVAVKKIAEHLIVLDEGQIIGQGDPHEVLENPRVMEAYIA